MKKYIAPSSELSVYNCPYCSILSKFNRVCFRIQGLDIEITNGILKLANPNVSHADICHSCNGIVLWSSNQLIYPKLPNIYEPNEDLNEDIKKLFNEAAEIYGFSPRAACALLRLCLEKLCIQLGGDKNKKINQNISDLIERERLPTLIQQMLDYVRVIGNSAVHPNEIQESDKIETAQTLFDLINMLADRLLTMPREMNERYIKHIPESTRNAIEERNKKNN